MTNYTVIENKISYLEKYLGILKRYKQYSREQIEKDVDIKGMVERYLYLLAQSAIDLAEAILSLKNLRKPTTFSETFIILEEAKIIDGALAEKMIKMVGFRNILAHDYAEINYDIVYDVLQNKLSDIEEFIQQIKDKLNI
jgi:uncharacterized protein YutE (UPF0331/DUF86 family)